MWRTSGSLAVILVEEHCVRVRVQLAVITRASPNYLHVGTSTGRLPECSPDRPPGPPPRAACRASGTSSGQGARRRKQVSLMNMSPPCFALHPPRITAARGMLSRASHQLKECSRRLLPNDFSNANLKS